MPGHRTYTYWGKLLWIRRDQTKADPELKPTEFQQQNRILVFNISPIFLMCFRSLDEPTAKQKGQYRCVINEI